MGVTWCNTKGIIDRIKASLDAGIPNAHVAFPFWMPLAKPDLPRLFEDLAIPVPESRWIYYRTPRGHIAPSGTEYAEFQRTYPDQSIGTKLGTTNTVEIIEVISHSPKLAHFGFECSAVVAALAGARGNYGYWVNTLPWWTCETWRLCGGRHWNAAVRLQNCPASAEVRPLIEGF